VVGGDAVVLSQEASLEWMEMVGGDVGESSIKHFDRCNTNATDPTVPTTSDPPPLIAEEEGWSTNPEKFPSPSMGIAQIKLLDSYKTADIRTEQEGRSIASSSSASLSLYYFTAESLMSSLEDYVDDAKVRASEARILQALATDYSTDDIGDMELELLLDTSSLDSSYVDRYFRFDRSRSRSFSSTSSIESDLSLTQREKNDSKDEQNAMASTGVAPLVLHRYRPIESYFQCSGKPTEVAPQCFTFKEQQHNGSIVMISAQPCISENQYTGKRRKAEGQIMDTLRLIRWFHRLQIMNNPFYNKQYSEASLCLRRRVIGLCFIGTAMEKIELLRRCFYPRRDVIKWNCFETGGGCL
jgi:hypothetical protein